MHSGPTSPTHTDRDTCVGGYPWNLLLGGSVGTLGADWSVVPHATASTIWDGSSGTGSLRNKRPDLSGRPHCNIPDSASVHFVHLRTLPDARAERSNLAAAADVASHTPLTPAEQSDALHLHRISSDAALLETSAGVVVKIYGFIAQATDSLQHLQHQYDGQCKKSVAVHRDD